MKIKNKTAIVTGASEGLGKEIALKLGNEGMNLALIARNKKKLKQLQKQIKGVKINIYPCDLKDLNQIKKTVQEIINDFSSVDILLNIAGIWQKKMPIEELDEQVIENVIATNLTGLIHMTRLIIPHLKKQEEAVIVNVSSSSGVKVNIGQSVYSATKWGVRGLTDVIREDLRDTNIKVAGIYQAGVKTDMFFKTGEKFGEGVYEKFMNPKDLANIITFMLSQPPHIWIEEVRVNYK
ncbi:MAG: SDR family oxidoreductase [Patescibacteria group bacterium]